MIHKLKMENIILKKWENGDPEQKRDKFSFGQWIKGQTENLPFTWLDKCVYLYAREKTPRSLSFEDYLPWEVPVWMLSLPNRLSQKALEHRCLWGCLLFPLLLSSYQVNEVSKTQAELTQLWNNKSRLPRFGSLSALQICTLLGMNVAVGIPWAEPGSG